MQALGDEIALFFQCGLVFQLGLFLEEIENLF